MGEPVCARPPNKIGEYAELGAITRDIAKAQEVQFLEVCKKRAEEGAGKIEVVDINKTKKQVELKEIFSLSQVIEGALEKFPGLAHMRVPICNSASPLETDFDVICETLVGTAINTPVIINDHVGLSRATTGCVIACLFKEFQITSSFEGLVETVPGMNLGLLKMDTYKMDMAKDTLFRGEFPVVMRLVEGIVGGASAKNICDKVVDKNGTPKTGGTGIKQLRENIAESKLSYEIMDDAAQAFLKMKIMDNIHKYYYLILYTAYIQQAGEAARNACDEALKDSVTLASGKCSIPADQLKIGKTFVQFMEENLAMRTLIDEGKGDLQWERDIPPAALANLEDLAKKDFKGNLGTIIHDI